MRLCTIHTSSYVCCDVQDKFQTSEWSLCVAHRMLRLISELVYANTVQRVPTQSNWQRVLRTLGGCGYDLPCYQTKQIPCSILIVQHSKDTIYFIQIQITCSFTSNFNLKKKMKLKKIKTDFILFYCIFIFIIGRVQLWMLKLEFTIYLGIKRHFFYFYKNKTITKRNRNLPLWILRLLNIFTASFQLQFAISIFNLI